MVLGSKRILTCSLAHMARAEVQDLGADHPSTGNLRLPVFVDLKRSAVGSQLPHDWRNQSCTKPVQQSQWDWCYPELGCWHKSSRSLKLAFLTFSWLLAIVLTSCNSLGADFLAETRFIIVSKIKSS